MAFSKLRAHEGSWLPSELVEDDILCKTSTETLIRLKSTCKRWYALLKDKSFIYKHYDHFQEQFRFIQMYYDKVQIINPTTSDILSLPVPAEFYFDNKNTIVSMIHCDGLLLCRCRNGYAVYTLAVWNPVMNQITWIGLNHSYEVFNIWGFGYDKDGYKILRTIEGEGFEIYDFKSKLWRFFPTSFDWVISIKSVSMKGNMYWIAKSQTSSKNFIMSFDFSKETFKSACASIPVRFGNAVALSGFGGDKLSLLHQDSKDKTREIEVWVTNKLSDEVVLWSKYFSVTSPDDDLPILSHPTYFINKRNSIILWCDKVVEDGYSCRTFYEFGEEGIINQVETGPPYSIYSHSNSLCTYVYVPSLVPVPE